MASRRSVAPSPTRVVLRCAVYTRKSSEEGLEQAFNSLDAQREACEAYIASQRHEGWNALPEMYDDGGFSGGTTDRPALQRLLADIAAGRIDVVVVYKVDRLTRALSDFARMVELFDKHRVSFVSVTQAFNTTTSMGRLTLNVLLSFAQFEREVTGERIRDKIAASKKKGMWMGGNLSLGYDVRDRKLVVNEAEAATVRFIFRRYAELRSVRDLKAELDAAGIVSKARRSCDGSIGGGQPLARGALYHLLSNRLYRGEIVHKGQVHAGEHTAILDDALFCEVQTILSANRTGRSSGTSRSDPSPLTGLVYDAAGERLTPTHAAKKGVQYRYYVSRQLITGAKAETGQRLPAPALEGLVRTRIGEFIANRAAMLDALAPCSAEQQQALAGRMQDRCDEWGPLSTSMLREALIAIVSRIDVHPDRIEITIDHRGLAGWLQDEADAPGNRPFDRETSQLVVPASLKRRGNELRLIIAGADDEVMANTGLMRLVARAHHVGQRLLRDRAGIETVAQEEGLTPSYITRLVRLSFLPPDITARLISGRHDPDVTARKLMADTRLPLDWAMQRKALGMA